MTPITSPYAGHSPGQDRPLAAYLGLSGLFGTLVTGFAVWLRRSGRPLPERYGAGDLALIALATHKSSRLIAKDRATSGLRAPFTVFQGDAGPGEVDEAARGRGLRRVIGELLICPYCLGMWISSAFTAAFIVSPRAARAIAVPFSTLLVSDVLQLAYARAERAATDDAA